MKPPIRYRHHEYQPLLYLAAAVLAVLFTPPAEAGSPTWAITAPLTSPRQGHSAIRLDDGRVLVVGGQVNDVTPLATAELYDPTTEEWTAAAPLDTQAWDNSLTLLDDGRVLLTAGAAIGHAYDSYARIYDPGADTWSTPDPTRALIGGPGGMLGELAVALPNGQVLTYGSPIGWTSNIAVLYDPTTDSFIPIASGLFKQSEHSLALLADGSVFASAGGYFPWGDLANANRAQLFEPDRSGPVPDYVNGTWREVSTSTQGHWDGALMRLRTGPYANQVVVCNGLDTNTSYADRCDRYNPLNESFTAMSQPRSGQKVYTRNSTLVGIENGPLNGYGVLVGGYSDGSGTARADLLDPASLTWTRLCDAGEPRLRHSVTPLADGRVLVVGGQPSSNGHATDEVRLLLPNLFDGDCDGHHDAIDDCPAGRCSLVTGRVYIDSVVEDCDDNPGERSLSGRMVRAHNGVDRVFAISDADGAYAMQLAPGTWILTLLPDERTLPSPACGAPYFRSVVADGFSPRPGNDFYLAEMCSGSISVTASYGEEILPQPCPPNVGYPNPCPGLDWTLCFTFANDGSGEWSSGTTFLIELDDAFELYGNSSIAVGAGCPSGHNEFYGAPNGSTYGFVLNSSLASNINTACEICVTALVSGVPSGPNYGHQASIVGDCDGGAEIIARLAAFDQPMTCSCDPNDKQVTPIGCGAEGYVSPQRMTYLIRFENIGSGPANDVVVRDTLDTDFDLDSLRILGSSHPVSRMAVDQQGDLTLWFDDIQLPPFTDYPLNRGYVNFQVDPVAGVPFGSTLENSAEIYFDNNLPVLTNLVRNTLAPARGPGAASSACSAPVSRHFAKGPR